METMSIANQIRELTDAQREALTSLGITTELLATIAMGVVIFVMVMALLNCFFGLKLVRVWAALIGLAVGFAVGVGAGVYFQLDATVALIIGAVAGLVLAFLLARFYRFGAFVVCWVTGSSAVFYIAGSDHLVKIIVAAAVGLVLALVSIKFLEPTLIVVTGLQGGLAAGAAICQLVTIPGTYTHYIIGAVLAVLGIVIQFILESKKKIKLHLAHAKKIREEHSTETEVEKLRTMLDDTDKVREDKDADDYYDDDEDEEDTASDEDDDLKFID